MNSFRLCGGSAVTTATLARKRTSTGTTYRRSDRLCFVPWSLHTILAFRGDSGLDDFGELGNDHCSRGCNPKPPRQPWATSQLKSKTTDVVTTTGTATKPEATREPR